MVLQTGQRFEKLISSIIVEISPRDLEILD